MPDARACALTLALLVGGGAVAHAIDLFVSVGPGEVTGMAYFASGARAQGVPVRALIDGVAVAETTTDTDGRFRLTVPEPVALTVEVATLDGHRAVWDVPENAWDSVPHANAAASVAAPAAVPVAGPAATGAVDLADLEARIDAAVARQVDRLREDLALAHQRRRVSDVVGGVGYLLGLTGLASLLWRRQRGEA